MTRTTKRHLLRSNSKSHLCPSKCSIRCSLIPTIKVQHRPLASIIFLSKHIYRSSKTSYTLKASKCFFLVPTRFLTFKPRKWYRAPASNYQRRQQAQKTKSRKLLGCTWAELYLMAKTRMIAGAFLT